MDEESVISYDLTASSNNDDIKNVLSKEDSLVWQPTDDDQTPELKVTILDDDKLISEVHLIGQYEQFTVTIGNKVGEILLDDEVSVLFKFDIRSCV